MINCAKPTATLDETIRYINTKKIRINFFKPEEMLLLNPESRRLRKRSRNEKIKSRRTADEMPDTEKTGIAGKNNITSSKKKPAV